jgi:surface carbohydrate biosynthesis protein
MFDTLFANELEKRGNVAWVRSFLDGDTDSICAIKPDILVIPEMRVEYSAQIAENFKKWGGKVVVRTCEMGVTSEAIDIISDEYRTAIYGHLETDHLIDCQLAFGPSQKRMMIRHGKVQASKIKPVGAMPFEQYFTKMPAIEGKKKPIMLLCTGFPYADRNNCYAIPESPFGSPLHAQKVKESRIGRSKWLNLIPSIYHVYHDQYDLIVRPHGGERHDSYKELLGGMVTVSTKSSAAISLHNADIIVHAGSTMGIEAHITNKPGISVSPMSEDPVLTALHPDGSTIESFVAAMESLELGKSNADPKIVTKLYRYFGTPDGKSSVRAAAIVDKIKVGQTRIPDKWPEIKEPRYVTDTDVVVACGQWYCAGCKHTYWVKDMSREMVKCPYCGIANVRNKPAVAAGGAYAK